MPHRQTKMTDLSGRLKGKYQPAAESGCWIWTGAKNKYGYGVLGSGDKHHRAHRVSYEAVYGQIPEGLMVCHTCDTPECVNPDHLFLGTHLDNMRDRRSKGRYKKTRDSAGERNPMAKLTDRQVNEIRHAEGAQSKIAEQFGVNQSTVQRIKAGTRRAALTNQPKA